MFASLYNDRAISYRVHKGFAHAEVALSAPTRLLKLFSASGVLSPAALDELRAAADLPGAIALQAGRIADMDFIARTITAQ